MKPSKHPLLKAYTKDTKKKLKGLSKGPLHISEIWNRYFCKIDFQPKEENQGI